jgi:outer membrane immunogenic protein
VKKLFLSTALFAIFATLVSANAADLPAKAVPYNPPPPPMFTWTGFYVGGEVGGVWAQDKGSVVNPGIPVADFAPFTLNMSSVIGGGHVGMNVQVSYWVIGLEGSIDATHLHLTTTIPGGLCPLFCPAATTNSNLQESVRGRLGVAVDRMMVYGTGGVAFTNIKNTYNTTPIGGAFVSITDQRTGWTAGAGFAYAVTNNWSVRAEYRFTDFGTVGDKSNTAFFPATTINRHITESQAELGLSYKFDVAALGAMH